MPEFDLMMDQDDKGEFDIEFMDNGGNVCSRIVVDSAGAIRVKGGARYGTLVKKYEMGVEYHIKALLSTSQHRAVYFVDGKKVSERQFDTPVEAITRIVFRTGKIFTEPNNETPESSRNPTTRRPPIRISTCRVPMNSTLLSAIILPMWSADRWPTVYSPFMAVMLPWWPVMAAVCL